MIVAGWNPLLGTDWNPRLRQEFEKPYGADLQRFVAAQRSRHIVYPAHDDVFAALKLTQLAETKAVILGQDPYPGAGQAHGLAFSVPRNVPKPRTLGNIYQELHKDLGCRSLTTGTSNHGTPRGAGAQRHTDGPRRDARLAPRQRVGDVHRRGDPIVDGKLDPVLFILWGKDAQRKKALIDTTRYTVICRRTLRHNPLTEAPSPSSGASRSAGPTARSSPQGGHLSIGG
jgi:uracil-DNA glycosylase